MCIMSYNKDNDKIFFKKGTMSAHFINILDFLGPEDLLILFLVL